MAEHPNGKQAQSWGRSLFWSALAVAVILPLALKANAVIGRTIHWDMAVASAVVAAVGLTLVFRHSR